MKNHVIALSLGFGLAAAPAAQAALSCSAIFYAGFPAEVVAHRSVTGPAGVKANFILTKNEKFPKISVRDNVNGEIYFTNLPVFEGGETVLVQLTRHKGTPYEGLSQGAHLVLQHQVADVLKSESNLYQVRPFTSEQFMIGDRRVVDPNLYREILETKIQSQHREVVLKQVVPNHPSKLRKIELSAKIDLPNGYSRKALGNLILPARHDEAMLIRDMSLEMVPQKFGNGSLVLSSQFVRVTVRALHQSKIKVFSVEVDLNLLSQNFREFMLVEIGEGKESREDRTMRL